MATKELYIEVAQGLTRYGMTDDGVLVQALALPRRSSYLVEGIYLGRVVQQVPNIDAVFVEFGDTRPGLLNKRDYPRGADKLNDGDSVIVQVERNSVEGKGARLTARPALTGRYLVFHPDGEGCRLPPALKDDPQGQKCVDEIGALLADGDGVVLRTRVTTASVMDVQAELEIFRRRWQAISAEADSAKSPAELCPPTGLAIELFRESGGDNWTRFVADDAATANVLRRDMEALSPAHAGRVEHYTKPTPLFSAAGLEDDWADALDTEVTLAGGGRLTIEQTAALTAIDVDTDAAGGTAVQTNLAAAEEIARQIRLRNLSGQLVVDFVSMPKSVDRNKVLTAFREACASDRHINVFGFTKMGLVELTRRRRGPSLAEVYRQTD